MTEPATLSPRAGIGGPKSAEGKARSAMNALKHGLRAERFVLLPDESRDEFDELVADLAQDLTPVGRTEVELVGKIAAILWKEIRADRMEGELLPWLGGGNGPGTLAQAMGFASVAEHEMNRVIRYQAQLANQLTRALAALRARQAERRGSAAAERTPPTAAAPAEPEATPPAPTTEPARPAREPRPQLERTPPTADAPAADPRRPVAHDAVPARGTEALTDLAEGGGVLLRPAAGRDAPPAGRRAPPCR